MTLKFQRAFGRVLSRRARIVIGRVNVPPGCMPFSMVRHGVPIVRLSFVGPIARQRPSKASSSSVVTSKSEKSECQTNRDRDRLQLVQVFLEHVPSV